MKPKGLLIAVVLLAVLGGLTWWSNKRQADKAKSPADAAVKMLSIPDDQFQEIRIQKVTGEVLDLKRESGKWRRKRPSTSSSTVSTGPRSTCRSSARTASRTTCCLATTRSTDLALTPS